MWMRWRQRKNCWDGALGDGEPCPVMLLNPDIELDTMIVGRLTKTRY